MIKSDCKNEIIDIITPVRLKPYESDLDKYAYNIQVAEAFYPVLAILEITLRNRINNAIEKFICKDWLLKELEIQKLLSDKEYKKLLDAENKIKKSGKTVTNDRLVSELTFGFWVHLCTKSYKPKFWDKKGFFEAVFPNYKSNGNLRNIAPIQNDLLLILRLRNRVFHHEIIINNKKSPQELYQILLDMINLLSTGMIEFLANISRFDKVVKQKP